MKKGQEEIMGFIVIVVIVGVIILILLGFLLMSPDESAVESYEVESFINAILQYTTDCESQIEFMSIQRLIISCDMNLTCLDGRSSCDVLDTTIEDIINSGWNVNEQSAIKGYELKILTDEKEMVSLEEGNKTLNYKGSFQDFARSGIDYSVSLTIYE